MESVFNENLIQQMRLPDPLKHIAFKVLAGERILPDEGLLLYEKGELGFLGMLAEKMRTRLNANDVFYIRNFHIEKLS